MRRPRAFTILELLVVIGVIGLLAGLLFPAVQAAREAGRRTQCAQNLHQIGLALQQYHSAHNAFPAGNYARSVGVCPGAQPSGPDSPTEDLANWMISILPQLDQRPLYASYNLQEWNEAEANRRVRETTLPVYVCPTDAGTQQLTVPAMGPAALEGRNLPYAPGSYRGVSGRSDGRSFLDTGEITRYDRAWRGALHVVGVLNYRPESLTTITDGSSNTLMAGESATRTNLAFRTFWAYSFSFYSLSAITPQARILSADYSRCCAADADGHSGPCRRGWGSFHPGGLHFLTCDGAVHFVATSIEMDLLAALSTIAGKDSGQLPK